MSTGILGYNNDLTSNETKLSFLLIDMSFNESVSLAEFIIEEVFGIPKPVKVSTAYFMIVSVVIETPPMVEQIGLTVSWFVHYW